MCIRDRHSPDVGSALRNLVFHLHLHDRGAVPNLSVEQGIAVLGYAIYQPGVEGSDQIYDGAIAITCNIMRALCGAAWVPDEVLFSHRRPSDIKSFRCFFQSRLRFDMEQTALVFPATWLDRPVAVSYTHLFADGRPRPSLRWITPASSALLR